MLRNRNDLSILQRIKQVENENQLGLILQSYHASLPWGSYCFPLFAFAKGEGSEKVLVC